MIKYKQTGNVNKLEKTNYRCLLSDRTSLVLYLNVSTGIYFSFILIYFWLKIFDSSWGFSYSRVCLFHIKSNCLFIFSDSYIAKTSEGSEDSDCERVRLTDINDETKNNRIQ